MFLKEAVLKYSKKILTVTRYCEYFCFNNVNNKLPELMS
jgi:hypothetical protein